MDWVLPIADTSPWLQQRRTTDAPLTTSYLSRHSFEWGMQCLLWRHILLSTPFYNGAGVYPSTLLFNCTSFWQCRPSCPDVLH